MSEREASVWLTLEQAGIVQGDAPVAGELGSPWYLRVLLAFCGWLAAIFLLGFLGVAAFSVFDNTAFAFVIGLALIGVAYSLLKTPKTDFFEHAALAMSLAGQTLLAWVVFEATSIELSLLIFSAIQFALAIFVPNFVHRVVTSFFATLCFLVALAEYDLPYLAGGIVSFAAAWLWLHEFKFPKRMRVQRAIGYGLVLALVVSKMALISGFNSSRWRGVDEDASFLMQPWLGEMLASAALVYVVWHLLRRLGHGPFEPITLAAMVGAIVLSVASIEATGVSVGITIVLLGFAGSNRVLMGLGIAALIFYSSSYYYLLDATLLEKSKTLLIVGIVAFFARWLLLRVAPKSGEVGA